MENNAAYAFIKEINHGKLRLISDRQNISEVCVIGRCNFETGVGQVTYAYCELLSRSFSVSIIPTEPHLRNENFIYLPNSRPIKVCSDPNTVRVSIFVDVLWNGSADLNYSLVPQNGLRIAYSCLDSDEVPARWVDILNSSFDIAAIPSPHLEEVLRVSGVEIPISVLPLAVDVDNILSKPGRYMSKPFRIGSIAAFHRRKGADILMDAFAHAFGDDPEIELMLHSNVVFPETLRQIQNRAASIGLKNILISTTPLSFKQKSELLESFDLYANMSLGEGFSIGPREALAFGTPVVLSEVGGHRHLGATQGVFLVPTTRNIPARYPEIDNMIVGQQSAVSVVDASSKLREAYEWARSDERRITEIGRRKLAADFSFNTLASSYAELIKPELANLVRNKRPSQFVYQSPAAKKMAAKKILSTGAWVNTTRLIVPAHDGGFFSIFNCFFSNMVWDLRNGRIHSILPDWDVGDFLRRHETLPIMSFCYGQPSDGNIWTKLYEPLFGLSEFEMNDRSMLYKSSEIVSDIFNARREPLLTYKHAYKLYKSPWFSKMRNQYHRIYKDHIKLTPHLQTRVDDFISRNLNRDYMIAAHVRHPSHTVEQPDAKIAHTDGYIRRILDLVRQRGFSEQGSEWGIFLATDQQRVTERFRSVFGDRVCFFENVRRTTDVEDRNFDALSIEEKNRDGYQLQHLVASNRSTWSLSMAEEVICDAAVMARCNALLHVVSNVSTAVAYMNPDLEMIYCTADM